MKKKVLIIFMMLVTLFPINTFAKEEKYTSQDLKEVFKEEEIEKDLKKYKENDKQITIYLFRGHGCTYCKAFLEFLSSITDEYGKYFQLESYEVWNNKNNADLMEEVSDFLDQSSGGVPYIVIGDKVFPGYSDTYNEQIKKAIKKEYKKKNRYDVLEEMEKEKKLQKYSSYTKNIMVVSGFIIAIISFVVSIVGYKKIKELKKEMELPKTTMSDTSKDTKKQTETKKKKPENTKKQTKSRKEEK